MLHNGTDTNAIEDYTGLLLHWGVNPPADEVWRLERLIVHIADKDIDTWDKYGDLATLSTGIRMFVNQSGVIHEITPTTNSETTPLPIRSNEEWGHVSYDVNIKDTSGAGAEDSFYMRWSFNKAGTVIRLDGATNDSFYAVLNDSFVGLDDHHFIVQGHQEVISKGGDKMPLGIIILIPLFIVGFLLAVSLLLDSEKYWALKLGLIMLSFVFVFQAYELSSVIANTYYSDNVLINVLADHALTFALIFGAFISIMLIQFVKDVFDIFASKKQTTGDYE